MPQFSIQLWKTLLPKPFWTICILQVGHFPSSRFIFLLSKLELLQEEEEQQQYINRKILVQLYEEFCADTLWPPLSTKFLLARRSRRMFDCYLEVCDTAYYHPHLRIRIQTSAWRPEVDELQLTRRQFFFFWKRDLVFCPVLIRLWGNQKIFMVRRRCKKSVSPCSFCQLQVWCDLGRIFFHSCAQKKHQVGQGDLNFTLVHFPKRHIKKYTCVKGKKNLVEESEHKMAVRMRTIY